MTRDRDEKRLVRAKAARERTSYVEACRRFDRSSSGGGSGDVAAAGQSSPSSPVRTTPLLMRFTHPSGVELGLIAMDQDAEGVAVDVVVAPAAGWVPQASLRLVGGEPFPRGGSGGGAGRMQHRFKGSIGSRPAEVVVGVRRIPEPSPDGAPAVVSPKEARELLWGEDPDAVIVRLRPAASKYERIEYAPTSVSRKEMGAAPSAGDALLPKSIECIGTSVDVLDGPAHWLLSMEHWSRSSALNVLYDSDEIEAGRLFGIGFEVVDDQGRRYEAVMTGGGGVGRRLVTRQRLFPRVASDARTLAFYRRGPAEEGAVAVLDLGRTGRLGVSDDS